MLRNSLFVLAITLLASTATVAPARAEGVDADAAFSQLRALAGDWRGVAVGEGEAETEAAQVGEVVHQFRVSAGGTVLMETMSPGTANEMINMYHRDGDDLVLTHYCSSGNQPRMRLDRARSTPKRLSFGFAGGTNLDATHDQHVHSAVLTFSDADHLQSAWLGQSAGKNAGTMTFQLERSR